MSQQLARSIIEIKDLTKTYQAGEPDAVTALKSIDLDVEDGEFLSIVGPSGCGKSTLLRIVAGLLDRTSGTVQVNDTDVTGPVADVGFVFQSPVLLNWRTVLNNVMFPYEALDSSQTLDKPREYYLEHAHELLELVGLEEFEDSYPYQLSGGMQQRVAISRALVSDPSILLMDEPFGALDEFTRNKLNNDLLDIFRETQKTILFVTHDIHESVYLSDRVLVLSNRPGQVKTIVDVDLDRPRSEDIRDSAEFVEYVSEIRENIEAFTE